MLTLNELEKAVLDEMVLQASPDLAQSLRKQIDSATVLDRTNSGSGFVTRMGVENIPMPIDKMEITVGANIDGFEHEMIFTLFVRGGVIRSLEGTTIRDSTVGVDFSQVRFVVSKVPTVWVTPRKI